MYRPVILNKSVPPCRKNGVDCPERRVGCQGKCERYRLFRENRDSELANALKENSLQSAIYNTKSKIQKMNRKR